MGHGVQPCGGRRCGMINKQDIIRFVVGTKVETLKSAMVIVTDDKRACPYIEGDQTTRAAAMGLVARENPDFKACWVTAASYLEGE